MHRKVRQVTPTPPACAELTNVSGHMASLAEVAFQKFQISVKSVSSVYLLVYTVLILFSR